MCIWQEASVCFLKITAATLSLQTQEEMSSENSPPILGINPLPFPYRSHPIVALIARCAFSHCISKQFHSAITILLHHLQIIKQFSKVLREFNRKNLNSLQEATKMLQKMKKIFQKNYQKTDTFQVFSIFFFVLFFLEFVLQKFMVKRA